MMPLAKYFKSYCTRAGFRHSRHNTFQDKSKQTISSWNGILRCEVYFEHRSK